MEKLQSLLRTKDWEAVTREPKDHHDLYAEPVFESCELTEREVSEFIGQTPTVDARGNIVDVWLEDEDFVYVLAPVRPGDLVEWMVLRRFKKYEVNQILAHYQVPEEVE